MILYAEVFPKQHDTKLAARCRNKTGTLK